MKIIHILDKQMILNGRDGGLPVMVDALARSQTKQGHTITVVSTKRSHTAPPTPYTLLHSTKESLAEVINQEAFELVHMHMAYHPIQQHCQNKGIGHVLTVHGLIDTQRLDSDMFTNAIFLSRAHAKLHQRAAYVYNGINLDLLQFQKEKQDYLLFLGKVSRSNKGAADAIRVARHLRIPLMLAGGRNNRLPSSWLPWPGSLVRPLGYVWGEQKQQLLANARCLLVPSQWEEPFGLIMIEALASGTPVLAFNRGAAPEIIRHGETGFICENWQDMAAKVHDASTLQPQKCLDDAHRRFSAERMADSYHAYYIKALSGELW